MSTRSGLTGASHTECFVPQPSPGRGTTFTCEFGMCWTKPSALRRLNNSSSSRRLNDDKAR